MKNSFDLEKLFKDQSLSQGQIASLNKIRFSLSNIWNNLALESAEKTSAISFSSCSSGEGTSFIAMHMALLVTHEYRLKTLYIDADLEKTRPKGSSILPGEQHEGLYHFLAGIKELDQLVKPTRIPGLFVLASGIQNGKPPPCNLLKQNEHIGILLKIVRSKYDSVIVDTPPISMSPLSLSFGKAVNNVVLVCRYARSRRQVCMHALEKIKQHEINLSGMILNERHYPLPMSIYNWLK